MAITKAEDRKKAYRDMLDIADKTYGYGIEALNLLVSLTLEDEKIVGYIRMLGETLELMARVIGKMKRRVLNGAEVLADEKLCRNITL